MSEFIDGGLVLLVLPIIMGYVLARIKDYVMKSETKLDDKIWNKLVGEFAAAGVIKPEQLLTLKNMGKDSGQK